MPLDRPRLTALAVALLLAACAGHDGSGGAVPEGPRVAYRCADGRGFAARFLAHSVEIVLADARFTLTHVRSASGARYQGPVAALGGRVTFWTKGADALLETPARSYAGCTGAPVGDG